MSEQKLGPEGLGYVWERMLKCINSLKDVLQKQMDTHTSNKSNPHGVTKTQVGLGNVENKSSATIRDELTSSNVTKALGYTPLNSTLKGVANGLAELDSSGKVPSSQLPAFVDDVSEYSAKSSFPSAGETGKIYVDLTTNKTYRWSGSAYVEISASLALGETSSTAYRGDRGKAAYDHSQKTSGNPHGVTKDQVGLGNVENVSTNNQTPTYTEADSNTALKSGETLSTAFGKIAKAVSSLISHLANTSNPHKVTVEQLELEKVDNTADADKSVKYAASAAKWATVRNINGLSVDGTANRTNYGTCSTAAATAAKVVACTGFALVTGAEITVKFAVTNTASSPTLNVNGTGAKAIYYRGSAISVGYLAANRTYTFRYNGTQYELVGDINTDTNTVYTHPTTSGNKHIPSGGSSGQILRWSADGTAEWGADNNTTYSQATASALGLVKIGYTESGKNYPVELNSTGQMFVNVPWTDTNTTYSNFVKSGNGAKAGLVPAPSTTAGTTKYLREDGTWAVPPNTTYNLSSYAPKASPVFTGSISLGRKSGTEIGDNSFAFGLDCEASGNCSHAEGGSTHSSNDCTHAEGYSTTASGIHAHAEGFGTTASGPASHSEGASTIANNHNTHAEGLNTTASGENSHSEGYNTKATNTNAHAEGSGTTASGTQSHAEGYNTTASGNCAHSAGSGTLASGAASHAGGYGTEALDHQYAIGHSNDTSVATKGTYSGTGTGTSFVIGNGTASAKSNAFRVTQNGATYAKSAYNSTGADYAEFFEWADGNPDNEDRAGYFVTFDEENPEMIRKANQGEYLLGIVSGNPCVIGNSDESWLGRYCFDEFGRYIYEEIEVDVEEVDNNGQPISKKEKVLTYKLNPDYDPERAYIPRSERAEWDYIGMMGVLSVYDDGTCIIGGYCMVADGGIATRAERGLGAYRVIKRVGENIIKTVFVTG